MRRDSKMSGVQKEVKNSPSLQPTKNQTSNTYKVVIWPSCDGLSKLFWEEVVFLKICSNICNHSLKNSSLWGPHSREKHKKTCPQKTFVFLYENKNFGEQKTKFVGYAFPLLQTILHLVMHVWKFTLHSFNACCSWRVSQNNNLQTRQCTPELCPPLMSQHFFVCTIASAWHKTSPSSESGEIS